MLKKRRVTRGGRAISAAITFAGIYGLLMAIVFLWGAKPVESSVNRWTAKTAASALRLFGADARARGDLVESSVSTIRIISECTVLYPLVIFISAVLAFPTSWKHRLWALFGVPVLAIVNLMRIVSLCYIDLWFPDAAETAHYVVWQSLMVFLTVLLWMLWAAGSSRTHESSPA